MKKEIGLVASVVSGGYDLDRRKHVLTPAAAVFDTEILGLDVDSKGDFEALIADVAKYYETLVFAGGDGVLQDALNNVPKGTPIGYLAMGSGNAGWWELYDDAGPFDGIRMILRGGLTPEQMASMALQIKDGSPQSVDAVVYDGKKAFIAGVGIDAEIISEKERLVDDGHGSARAYLQASLSSVMKHTPIEGTVTVGDETYDVSRGLNILVNKGKYNGYGFNACPEAELDSGELHVRIVEGSTIPTALKTLVSSQFGGNTQGRSSSGERVVIETDAPRKLQLGGDYVATGKRFEIDIEKDAHTVIVGKKQ